MSRWSWLLLAVAFFALHVHAQSLNWGSCNDIPGVSNVECATFNTVGDYSTQSGSMSIRVRRILGSSGASSDFLWLVSDGPGLAGSMYNSVVPDLRSALNGRYTMYIMDHRGTGQSTPLRCPDSTSQNADCGPDLGATYGQSIDYYNSYAIVRDYQTLTERFKSAGGGAAVFYGSGYGAYLINQLLLLNETGLVDAVVFDSYMYPSLVNWDENSQRIGLRFVDRCTNFGACRSQLNLEDPEDVIANVFQRFRELDCVSQLGVTRRQLQTSFRNIASDPEYRALLLPIAVRLLRCDSEDLDYLRNGLFQFDSFFYEGPNNQTASSTSAGESYALRNQILIDEFLPVRRGFQPDAAELQALSEQYYFSNYLPTFISGLSTTWPSDANELVKPFELSSSTVPALIISGEFDFVTDSSYSARLADVYDNARQRFVQIPFGTHMALVNTPTQNGTDCGFNMVVQFLRQSTGAWDPYQVSTKCIGNLVPVDYAASTNATRETSLRVFGYANPWGSGIVPPIDNGGDISVSGSSIVFSTNDLPPVPNLSLSRVVVFDTYDTSDPNTVRNTLSYVSTGVLLPADYFTSEGGLVNESLGLPALSLLALLVALLFI